VIKMTEYSIVENCCYICNNFNGYGFCNLKATYVKRQGWCNDFKISNRLRKIIDEFNNDWMFETNLRYLDQFNGASIVDVLENEKYLEIIVMIEANNIKRIRISKNDMAVEANILNLKDSIITSIFKNYKSLKIFIKKNDKHYKIKFKSNNELIVIIR